MLDLSSLKSALDSLANAVSVAEDRTYMDEAPLKVREVIEAGVIQNFTITYELCYKFMVRWITLNISPQEAAPRTKREIFRTAARYGLIRDPKRWFAYTDPGNETSHTYDRQKAEKVLFVAREFLEDARSFYHDLEKLND
jgi:nucleotidyltransferase substrate binding protein (TIGR01987 family)